MRLELEPVPALPRLAWLARCRGHEVRVLHGSWVETRDDSFVEGAWDGPFAANAFESSAVLAGSGGKRTADGILFATPANLYERLQSIRVGDELLVSNSLALLLAASGDRFDPAHPHYYLDLLDHYRRGIRDKRKSLRLAGGRSVELHDCCNLEVRAAGEITRVEKPWGPPPAGCDAYLGLLRDTLARVIDNAAASERRHAYRPVAMVSQGYDSTAVAALARDAGCREAVTFLRSDGRDGYEEDGGEAIGTSLGLAVTAYERDDHATSAEYRAEEFYIEPWGVDRCMAVMAPQLAGALLLSGRSGETVWSRGNPLHWGLPDLQHDLDILPGCALGELRLRIGFLHFAPATIAAVHAPIIHAWNATPELGRWSVGGGYDKPIARRIAESAGVPRELFGQAKKGGMRRSDKPPTTLFQRVLRDRPRLRALALSVVGNRFHAQWRLGSFAVQAGGERMIERYRRALETTT